MIQKDKLAQFYFTQYRDGTGKYKKKNQSFQNAADTYTQVITKDLDGMADLQMNVSDKAIGSLIMRYNETSWEFAQRMVLFCKLNDAPVVTLNDAVTV